MSNGKRVRERETERDSETVMGETKSYEFERETRRNKKEEIHYCV